jgi:ribosome biogenesis GTPase A
MQETQNRYYLTVKDWKQIVQGNRPKNQARIVILIFNKIDFQPKLIKRDWKEHFILKGKTSPRGHLNSE